MRTTTLLRPPEVLAPPPETLLRIALVHAPQQTRVVRRLVAVVQVVIRTVKTLWARTPFRSWSRTDRPVSVFGARGPPS